MVDYRIDTFDKNLIQKRTPPKDKQVKAASASNEPINPYSNPEVLEGCHYVNNSPDNKSSKQSFNPKKTKAKVEKVLSMTGTRSRGKLN